MALRPFLRQIPRIFLHPSHVTMRQSKQETLPYGLCLIHSSHRFEKKKKGAIYVTMALEQEVQVYDMAGKDLGMMLKSDAEDVARSRDFHLLLVPDKSKYHPVLRFCKNEEFREEQKREKKEKREHAKPKQKRLSIDTRIMEHDLNVKVSHVVKLLQKDCHVTVRIQNSVPEKEKQLTQLFGHFSEACKEFSTIKQVLKNEHEIMFLLKPTNHDGADSKEPLTPLLKNKHLKDAK